MNPLKNPTKSNKPTRKNPIYSNKPNPKLEPRPNLSKARSNQPTRKLEAISLLESSKLESRFSLEPLSISILEQLLDCRFGSFFQLDDEVEYEEVPVEKPLPILKEMKTANVLSTPSSEEDGSDNCDEGPSEAETPEIVTTKQPEILFCPTKRCHINEGADVTVYSPSSSPKESGKFCGFSPEINEENGLARRKLSGIGKTKKRRLETRFQGKGHQIL